MSNFINDNIKIDFAVNSKSIKNLMTICEEADKEDNYGKYEAHASLLTDTVCKEAYVVGDLTKKQWEKFESRYIL